MAEEKKYIIPDYKPPDWTIGELYHKSFEIIKKNKVLWLFGMAVAGAAAGSSNIRFDKLIDLIPDEGQKGEELSSVLGASTSIFGQLLSNVPTFIYILGGIEIAILIIIGIVIGLITNYWANASLIEGIQTALTGGNVSIRDSSEKAFRSIKSLVWLAIVPTLVFALASLIIFPILAIPLIVGGLTIKVLGGLILAITVLIWIVVTIFLSLAQIWAPREVIIAKKPWREAFFAGIKIARRKFWSTLLLGLVNTILTMIVVGIPVGIMVGFLVGGFLTFEKIPTLGIGLFATGGILLLAFVILGQLFGGIITAFKASVWTIAYNNIRGKYDK